MIRRCVALFVVVGFTGCNFIPKPQAPEMQVPPHFKEAAGWKLAAPADATARGAWWGMFADVALHQLLQQVEVSNQSLAAAAARAEQTAALLKSAKLAFLPSATVMTSDTKNKSGSGGGSSRNFVNSVGTVRETRSVAGSMNWEIDLWGRLRHSARAATADAQAAQADLESTRLSLQAQAATTYFSLRASEAQRQLLETEVANYQKSLDLTKNREVQGIASKADVAQAETQLATTRAGLIELGVSRATLEHALATLTGQAPAGFSLTTAALTSQVPAPPQGTPSTVLQRRPDVAAAERRVAAANERIGAARAAFFPALTLNADSGWRGLTDLFAKANQFWSLGADAATPLLDSGQRLAAKAQADASYAGTVADYRQTVLTALQETEDALATLRILAEESAAQAEAVKAARESERIAKNQYAAGTLSYLNVATAQATAQAAERNAIDLRVRRLNATVALVKALGGQW